MSSFRDLRLARMAAFLGTIGIDMRAGAVDVPTLFPGSLIDRGSLIVDESKLVAPGDALHEAAHGGEELTTIAWCWVALLEIDVAPEDIYHGRRIRAVTRRRSSTPRDAGRLRGVEPFPHMVRWVRE
jgi:hypothetical protein